MNPERNPSGEVRNAVFQYKTFLVVILVFSVFINLLMFTGPLFMMQVYDRVISSRNEATLLSLFLLIMFLFLIMGVLEVARNHIMERLAVRFQEKLDKRVFFASMAMVSRRPGDPYTITSQKDLEVVRQFISSPLLISLIDIPWTPLFMAAIFVFHPLMGWLGLAGGAFLILVTYLNQQFTYKPRLASGEKVAVRDRFAEQIRAEAETINALGMRGSTYARWESVRRAIAASLVRASDIGAVFSTTSKVFRLFIQSAMLALGAWLVLQDKLSPGAMIASSILLGRALAPIEGAVAQWPLAQQARQSWRRLGQLLAMSPPDPPRLPLPRPQANLEAIQLSVAPPGGGGRPVLHMISFSLREGQVLGVIGPSASGKSTLARALTRVWPILGGVVRLDGAAIEQYDSDAFGRYVGYLPQRVALFDGTIAENIARLDQNYDPEAVIRAAKLAGAHDMIVNLPEGYDTWLTANGGRLSGGQIQRIGLARALYGDPVVVVLDEPSSNLDHEGSSALVAAIRSLRGMGRIVVLIAHRSGDVRECDHLLVIEAGRQVAMGPREQVLSAHTQNAALPPAPTTRAWTP